jgi:aspartyl protease family protein
MATGFMGVGRAKRNLHSIAALLGLALIAPAQATDVALVGLYSGKALVIIDGGKPRVVPVGTTTREGVKVLSLEEGAANLEIDGHTRRLTIGQHAVSAGSDSSSGGTATLTADAAGHFITMGTVNGAPTRFLVDTGATLIAMSAADATRANVDYQRGEPGVVMTANGPVRVWRVMLNSVRVGDVVVNQVDASVQENNLPFALLGMSFLNRMEMRRDGSTMTLKKRF